MRRRFFISEIWALVEDASCAPYLHGRRSISFLFALEQLALLLLTAAVAVFAAALFFYTPVVCSHVF